MENSFNPATSGEKSPPQSADSQAISAQVSKLRLGDRLISQGMISHDQLQVALMEQRRRGKMLGEVLVELGFITEHALSCLLSESSGADRLDLRNTVLDAETVRILPRDVAERYKAIIISANDSEIRLAMSDIYNVVAIDQISRYFPRGVDVIPLISSDGDIAEAIDKYYGYELTIDGLLREMENGGIDGKNNPASINEEGFVNPTVRLVNAIILDAIKQGTSDLHIEPEAQFVRLRYRLDGVMTLIRSFHKEYWPSICVRLKIMSGMNIAEQRHPQDGRFTFNIGSREVDFRVSNHPTVHGENVVIRVLDKSKALVPLEKLGYAPKLVADLKTLLKRPEGIVIVTGPTGSGKTTSLYSMLNHLNSMDVNIMTLEQPVEYQLPLLRQSDIKDGGGMSFADGVRSIMRQDPDIVFVGEVRDEATAMMALRAAMTGHQVFTSLHTNDALGAINRLTDLGLPRNMLAGSIIMVLAQRLIRKLCRDCRREGFASEEDCRILGADPNEPPRIFHAVGCDKCRHTGYKGRTATVELLPFSPELDELVAVAATRGQLLAKAKELGFRTMADDGVEKVLNGETSVEELVATVNLVDRLMKKGEQ